MKQIIEKRTVVVADIPYRSENGELYKKQASTIPNKSNKRNVKGYCVKIKVGEGYQIDLK